MLSNGTVKMPIYPENDITLQVFQQYLLDIFAKWIIPHYFSKNAGNGTISALLPELQNGLTKIMEITNKECEYAFMEDFIVKHDSQRKHAQELWDTMDNYLTNLEYKRKIADLCKAHTGKKPLIIMASLLIKLVPEDENISCLRTDKFWHIRLPIATLLPRTGIIWYKIMDQNEPLIGGGKLWSTSFRETIDSFKAHNNKKHSAMLWGDSILHATDRYLLSEDEKEENKRLFPLNPGFFYLCMIIH